MNYQDIDWNTVWKELYERNAECRGRGDCASMWASEEKARSFLAQSLENPERIHYVVRDLSLGPDCRVLDIGAGPGTYAVPLAGLAGHVTAVEPAAGMAEVMEEYAAEKRVFNLDIVRKRWEDVNPEKDLKGPYDLVIAPYSLGMPDIREAIEKMCSVASGRISLFWFAGETSWEKMMFGLWPRLHGRVFSPGPKADVLFNLLWSMGIYPDVETSNMEHVRRFANMEAAVAEYREQYGITMPEEMTLLEEHLSSLLLSGEDGALIHSGVTTRVRLSWEVNGCR